MTRRARTVAARTVCLVLLAQSAAWLPAQEGHGLPDVDTPNDRVALHTLRDDLALPVSLSALDAEQEGVAVVQLEGTVVVVDASGVRAEPLLDLRHRVTGRAGEQGLFSVAIEPATRAARRGGPRMVVAAFTERETGDVIVAAYPLDEERWTVDADRETLLLRVPVPEPFHHGGQVAFGPDDMLWISLGDGEAANDFLRLEPPTAQDLRSLRGKLVRIDPFPLGPGLDLPPYVVPPDNPFPDGVTHDGSPAAPEIWAYGFRNPWKFTFDAATGDVLLADVGNDRWEEINRVRRGGNHGWPSREGRECQPFPDAPGLVDPSCPERTFVEPLVALPHLALDPRGAQAVTGGTVVADPELPELLGRYVFGDFVTGRLWAVDLDDGHLEFLLDTGLALTHVATGTAGEVLLIGINGVLSRLVTRLP